MICPKCEGRKGGDAFVCGRNVGGIRWMTCSTCKGTGEITDEQNDRIQEGRAFAVERMDRRQTVRKEAERLGCSVVEVSDIEHGREPQSEAGKKALLKRRAEMAAK